MVEIFGSAARLEEAQHVINLAAADGHFERFLNLKNCRATWALVRESALELLCEEYPDVDVKVVAEPGSNAVEIKAVRKKF